MLDALKARPTTSRSASTSCVVRSKSRCVQIVRNAGGEPSVVVNKIKEGKGSNGYNAGTGMFVDMIEAGIIDPAKVTRMALQNAASVAGLLLTTEAMIAEAPKKDDGGPSMPSGGGMGGMGGMGDF